MGFTKKYAVRWSEIDLNMHLTSAAYVKYITDTRMSFFEESGFGLKNMKEEMMGPIVISEKSYFFKEIRPNEEIEVVMTNAGASADRTMIRLEQRINGSSGKNHFLAYTLMAFIDLRKRKMAVPTPALVKIIDQLPKSDRYKILEEKDLRDSDAFPLKS